MAATTEEAVAIRFEGRASASPAAPPGAGARRRGRPMEMAPEEVLERIRAVARRRPGLFRVHRERAALYARARRLFGSWEGAVRAAGLDYASAVTEARPRALEARRRKARSSR